MSTSDPSLEYICDNYLNIADQLIAQPEGVIPKESADRELFTLLSDFYLKPSDSEEENLDDLEMSLFNN